MPLLLLLLALALALPASAQAGVPTTIGFEEIAPGELILDQYANLDLDPRLSNEGVEFGRPSRFGLPDDFNCAGVSGVAAGITGRSAHSGCGNELRRDIAFALRFRTTRRGLSFKLRGRNPHMGIAHTFAVSVRLYNSANRVLEEREVTVRLDRAVGLSLTRATADIAKLTITGGFVSEPNSILFDDLVAPLDDRPPPPEFALALRSPQLEIAEGATGDVPVAVERYNGSTGPVTLAVPELVPGIAAAQLLPNPVMGTAPAALRVTAARPFTGTRQLAVTASGSASAGRFAGSDVFQNVRVVPALTVSNQQVSVVPGCGAVGAELLIGVRGGYRGRVTVEIARSGRFGPVEVLDRVVMRDAAGDGTLRVPFRLRQPVAAGGRSELVVAVRPERATAVTAHVTVFERPLRIDSGTAQVRQPRFLFDGTDTTDVELRGAFPDACAVTYLDGIGRVLAVRAPGPERTLLRLPAQPVSTVVRAIGPGGVVLAQSPRIEVQGFRNGPALPTRNSGAGAGTPNYTWDDFVRNFGRDDADNCYPLIGCSRDGDAWDLYRRIRADLAALQGMCFGYSTMALRFDRAIERPSAYDRLAGRAFDLAAFAEGSPLKRSVVHWQVSQYDAGFQEHVRRLEADVPTYHRLRDRLVELLRRDRAAYITVRRGDSGHAVVAYDVRDRGDAGFEILTYNPNFPYGSGSPPGLADLNASTIVVKRDGTWTARVSGVWTGDLSTIEAFDRLPPQEADMDEGFLGEIFGDAGAATVTGIRAGGVEALRADGTVAPGSGVRARVGLTGVHKDVAYELEPGRDYRFTIEGRRAGEYAHSVTGGAAGATIEGLRTAAGQRDTVTLRPGHPELGWTTGARDTPVRVKLHSRSGGARRAVALALTSTRGGGKATLTGGKVTLHHDGPPTTVAATLETTGAGGPMAVTTRPIRVGAGSRLELRPRSWGDLSGGARLTVRDRRGRVVRSGAARLRAARSVGLGSRVVARLRGRVVNVSARVTKAGGAPLVIARAVAVRGGRVVARGGAARRGQAAVRDGRIRIPVRLRRVPPGARVRVTLTLVDEAAGFAGVTRRAGAR